jgi:tetratricopeptide (TPR) repeat protein
MKRVNAPLLLALLATVVVAAGGIFFLHRYQTSRNAGGIVALARQRIKEGKTADAMSLYARYLGLKPNDPAVVQEYGELLLERAEATEATRADIERAFRVLERAVRLNPDNDSLRRDVAEFDISIGRFSDAREHVNALLTRISPDADVTEVVDIRMLEASAAYGEGDFDEAAQVAADLVGYDLSNRVFREGVRAPVSAEAAYALLARTLQFRLNAPDAAKQVLDRLVAVHGDSPEAWTELARWHRQANAIDRAKECARTAIEIAPDDARVVFTAFDLALRSGDTEWAATLAARAKELAPDDERTYRCLAMVAIQRGDREAALAALEDGVTRMPAQGSLLILLADIQLQMEQIDAASQTVSRISAIFGDTSPAVGVLESRLLMGRKNWVQANRRLQQIRPLAAGAPGLARQIDTCLAICAENLGDHDEQLAVNRRILVEDPTSIAARIGSAAALYAAGRNDEALEGYESIAESIDKQRLVASASVWFPLLQLRIGNAVQQPIATRDWTKVDDLLTTLLESGSVSDARLTLLRADVLAQKGEVEPAIDLLERLVADDEADGQAWLSLAALKLRSDGAVAAREVMTRMPESLQSAPGLLLLDARVALREPGVDESLAEIEKRGRDLDGDDSETVLRGLATLHLDAGRTDDAERLWQEIATRHPDDLQARSALLQASLSGSDPEKMRAAAAAVAAISGNDSARARLAEAWVRILDVKLDQRGAATPRSSLTEAQSKALGEARGLLTDAEAVRPGWAQIHLAQAEVEGLLGNAPAAIERLQRAVELAPTDRRAIGQLCALLFASDRLDEARAALANLGTEPGEGFERLRAELELRDGRLDQAAALAMVSVSEDSTNSTEWLWLGQLLDRCGKMDRAGDAFQRATETGPDRPEVWLALVAHQLATGQPQAARQTVDRAAEAVPSDGRPLLLAQCQELLGEFDEAEESFRMAVAQAPPGDLKVIANHAAFLLRRGRPEPARVELRRLIDKGRDAPGDAATLAWARRTLADLVGTRSTYKDLEEALALLRENASSDGAMNSDDIAAELRLLVDRPEPTSWRRGISMIDSLAERRPLSAGQRLIRAQLLEKCGRWSEARDELVAVVSGRSTPAPFVAMLVEKLLDHGEVATARDWFGRLESLAPDAGSTRALHARLVAAENDWTKAVEIVHGLVPNGEITPEQARTLGPLARLLENFGFPEEAEAAWRQFASRSPEGVVGLADFLGRNQRADEALDLLDSARSTLSAEQLVATALGAVRASGAKAEACSRVAGWLDKAAQTDPDSMTIAIMRAELLGVMDRHDEAEAAYRQLLASDALSPTQVAIVANNLAFHLARPETAAEAERLINTAMQTLGPHPDLLDTRGLIRLAAGDGAGALEDLEEAVLVPSATKYLHLAYANMRTGNIARAREALDKSRERGLGIEVLSPAERTMLEQLELRLRSVPDRTPDTGGARSAG